MNAVRASTLSLAATLSGLAIGLTASLPLAEGQIRNPTIGVDEIKEGMKGYGLTVFRGTEPERFDVEVVGTLHNFRPGQDLVLVKTPHPRLNITKNVKGMSGSPIFLNGRLAGAYSYSLSSFNTEPVAGFTPIQPMLTELHREIPPGFWPFEGGAPLPGKPSLPATPMHRADVRGGPNGFVGAPGQYDLMEHAAQLAARSAPRPDGRGIVQAATPLLMSGMGDRAAEFARKLFEPLGLEPLQAGGGGEAKVPDGAPQHYVDGGAIGVQLTRGDVSMMGLGTVTHVEGAKLCGFGHPMMNGGDTALPTTIGKVLWIYASDQHSFKVGESLRPLGALVQDRQSAIVADERKTAPTFPVHIEVRGVDGAPQKAWNMEVADERFMSAGLSASMLGSVVEATISERRDMTWQLHSRLTIARHGTVDLDDFGVAIGGLPEAGEWASARAVRAIGDVLNNPWEPARVERMDAVLTVQYARDMWHLRGVSVMEDVVSAGEKARLVVHLRPFAGPEVTRTIDVTMPPELAGRDVDIEVLPGYEVAPELAAPENLSELIANEPRQSANPRTLAVQFRVPSQGLTFQGHVAPRLPDFALDALRPAHGTIGPDPFASYARTFVPMERYVEGRDKVRVKVRPVVR